MKHTLFQIAWVVICTLVIAQGALQCFAPQRLKEVQDRLRLTAYRSDSAGGALFEKMRVRQAAHPPLLYRFSGLMLMAFGIIVLLGGLGWLRR